MIAAIAALRAAMGGDDVERLQRAVDEFGKVTAPLAELQMNAAVKSLLTGKRESDIAKGINYSARDRD